MKSILDRSFRYTPSVATNLRKTFARVRRELARQQGSWATDRERDRRVGVEGKRGSSPALPPMTEHAVDTMPPQSTVEIRTLCLSPAIERVCPYCGAKHAGPFRACSPCKTALDRGE